MRGFVNLILAELSILIVIGSLHSSPLSLFVPPTYLYILAILPPIMLAFRRNPYDFPIYALLIAILSVKALTNSEMLYSLFDAIYYFGFRSLANQLNSIFSTYKGSAFQPLLLVTTAYCISLILWNMEIRLKRLGMNVKYPIMTLSIVGVLICFFYPILLTIQPPNFPLLFLGVLGVALILVALLLLA